MEKHGSPLGKSFVRYSSNWKYSTILLKELMDADIISESKTPMMDYYSRIDTSYSLTQKGYDLIGKIEKLNSICPLDKF